jgi:hypothetical protein
MKFNFMNEIYFMCLRNFTSILCDLLWYETFVLLNIRKSTQSKAFFPYILWLTSDHLV